MAMHKKLLLAAPLIATGTVSSSHAQQILELDIAANKIGYSVQTNMLYATIPSSVGIEYGNRLIEISPVDATIAASVFVGSEPDFLSISPDAAVAYVGLDGAAAVRRIDLTTMTAGIQFAPGPPTGFGPQYPTQIAVMPGAPNTIAVSRHDIDSSPNYQGVAILDNGVMRQTTVNSFYGPTALAFGTQSNTLYGYDNYGTWAAYRMSVDASGVTVASSAPYVISGQGVTIVVDNNLIYATSGAVVDGAQLQLVGTYTSSGPVVVDDSTLSVAFVHGNVVQVFDRDTFLPKFSIRILSARGNPTAAVGCGAACIAIVVDSKQIFILPNVTEMIFADGFE